MFESDLSRARALLGDDEPSTIPTDGRVERISLADSKEKKKITTFLFPTERFVYAGLKEEQAKNYFLILTLLTLVTCVMVFITKFTFFLLVPLIFYCFQLWNLNAKSRTRQADFDKDYAALLLSLASALKTGLDPMVALGRSGALFQKESVLAQEIANFEKRIGDGVTEDKAIDAFGSSVNHPDIKLFRMAFKLARKEGASLSLCLQRLAKVTRQRQSFRRKTKAAVAMQKLSAFGIAGCTILIGIIQGVSSPDSVTAALTHPLGKVLLGGGLGLVSLGILWMLNMAKLKV